MALELFSFCVTVTKIPKNNLQEGLFILLTASEVSVHLGKTALTLWLTVSKKRQKATRDKLSLCLKALTNG